MSLIAHLRSIPYLRSGATTVLIAALVAGCGAGSANTTTTGAASSAKHAATTTRTPASGTGTTISTASATTPTARTTTFRSNATGPLVYARCMRANGVHNFPDPSSANSAAFQVSPAVASSPTFNAANARCQRYLGAQADFQTNPSKQTMAKLLRIATCMRAHGIHQFPDPLYNRPRHFSPGQYQEITDFDGATLLFPTSMDLQAPAYRHALTACGAPPLGLPH